MKKRVFLAGITLSMLTAPLSACVAQVICLDHVDADGNGICDHCGQKVDIKQESNVAKIAVTKLPTKTYYAMGEELELDGGEVTVSYKDETPELVLALTDTKLTISAPNMASKGKKMVGVRFEGKQTSFEIEVGDKKFTVSFDLGFDGSAIPSQSVVIKTHAEAPADPTREGYDFGGWYADSEFKNPFDFNTVEIMEDTVIYAKWFKQYNVTYALNYDNAPSPVVRKTYLGKAVSDVTPDARDGFSFAGWYADDAGNTPFDFNKLIEADTTIYAKWVADSVAFFTVTFNTNYGETPVETTAQVAEGTKVSRPADPTRANVTTKGHQVQNYAFKGWFTDAACTTPFNFDTEVSGDIKLYAGWTGQYIFEAEHVSFLDEYGDPIQGMGASGGSQGANMVDSPSPNAVGINASNGYYVTYLYSPGLTLTFNIVSDRAVSDATLTFRVTCEKLGYALSPTEYEGETDSGNRISNYTIQHNGNPIEYNMVEVSYNAADYTATDGWRPFSDFVLVTNFSLVEGNNKFEFISSNMDGMGGTMAATAPVIDCLKIDTSAELSWSPIIGNEFGQ